MAGSCNSSFTLVRATSYEKVNLQYWQRLHADQINLYELDRFVKIINIVYSADFDVHQLKGFVMIGVRFHCSFCGSFYNASRYSTAVRVHCVYTIKSLMQIVVGSVLHTS